jgi:hypothetical protein
MTTVHTRSTSYSECLSTNAKPRRSYQRLLSLHTRFRVISRFNSRSYSEVIYAGSVRHHTLFRSQRLHSSQSPSHTLANPRPNLQAKQLIAMSRYGARLTVYKSLRSHCSTKLLWWLESDRAQAHEPLHGVCPSHPA